MLIISKIIPYQAKIVKWNLIMKKEVLKLFLRILGIIIRLDKIIIVTMMMMMKMKSLLILLHLRENIASKVLETTVSESHLTNFQ